MKIRKARHLSDDYPTPKAVIEAFLSQYIIRGSRILDPAAGTGHFGTVLREHGYDDIHAIECRKDMQDVLQPIYRSVTIADFLTADIPRYDTIITNPPYSLAYDFACKALRTAPEVILLLRLGFLESRARYHFWQHHVSRLKLFVLSERPSFTGGGTDSTAYAWFVWNEDPGQEIRIIGKEIKQLSLLSGVKELKS